MPSFRPRRDDELDGWSDDDLIAHIRAAREAGDRQQARLALQILVNGHYANITRRVSLKIPPEDVDLVASAAFESAFTSAFDGQSVGEFHSWLQTIVARRIADYHRRDRPRRVELIIEHGEEDPDLEHIEARSAIDQALGELSEAHRVVIDLYVLNDAEPTAQEVADRINEHHGPDPPMTDQNVQQIASRFRKRLRELLLEGDT